MINLFLIPLILILAACVIYLFNQIHVKTRNLEERENILKIQIKNIELREKDFDDRYSAGKKEFYEREIELREYYQNALTAKEQADKIQEQSQTQVNLLKQKIAKLQTEIENARQKSKRLAKKAKNAV